MLGDLRFELHTAPTYGWWMTVAEWWFTELAEQGLGRSPTQLAVSRTFLRRFESHAVPMNWRQIALLGATTSTV